MKKRGRIFLGALVVSLTLMRISTAMTHFSYPSLFGGSPSEKICLEQVRDNLEFSERASQILAFTGIALKFGSIRNTIGVNAKTSCLPTWIFPARTNITAQILLQPLPRASPP